MSDLNFGKKEHKMYDFIRPPPLHVYFLKVLITVEHGGVLILE
jgi:hypothetical protein